MSEQLRQEWYVFLLLSGVLILLWIFPFLHTDKEYSYTDVAPVLKTEVQERNMEKRNASFVRKAYGLTQDQWVNGEIYGYAGAMNVEEIAWFEAADATQGDAIVQACEHRIRTQWNAFHGYGTTQCEILEHARIQRYGNVILCIIVEDADAVITRMEDSL